MLKELNYPSYSVAIAGNWGQWSYWGLCSVSCGGGRQYRNRNCDDPPPKNGGEGCEGDDEEEKACNTKACGGVGSVGLKKGTIFEKKNLQCNNR